jgi:urease accessory protein
LRLRQTALATIVFLFASSAAFAHTGVDGGSGFGAGFSHPFGGLDHALAMIAVGIWGAVLGRPLIWVLPVAFPLMMVVGGIAGIGNLGLPFVETGIAVSVIALGLAIAAGWAAPRAAALALVGIFALFHGYAHGQELPQAADPAAYAAGFVVATGLLHVIGIAFGAVLMMPWGQAAVRTSGAIIAVLGLWILAGAPGAA